MCTIIKHKDGCNCNAGDIFISDAGLQCGKCLAVCECQISKCKGCGKRVNKADLFSGNLCLECYKKKFDELSDSEKKPDFTKTINL